MEEKERFVFKESTAYELLHILDTKSNEKMRGFPDIVKILNQQDKRIKELEEMNKKLEEENGYIIFSDGYDENGNEVHKQEFVKYKDKFNELVEENKKLKQSQKQIAISNLEWLLDLLKYPNVYEYYKNHETLSMFLKRKINEQIKEIKLWK